jgi:hypothetical protein
MLLEDYHKFMTKAEASAQRYPEGYRQYENYASYSFVNPEASIGDY